MTRDAWKTTIVRLCYTEFQKRQESNPRRYEKITRYTDISLLSTLHRKPKPPLKTRLCQQANKQAGATLLTCTYIVKWCFGQNSSFDFRFPLFSGDFQDKGGRDHAGCAWGASVTVSKFCNTRIRKIVI